MNADMKILITGRNRKVAKDICDHLNVDRDYWTLKCDPGKKTLFDMLLAELPKVIIVCLGGESVDTVKTYDVLKNASRQGNCTIIVIATEEDEKFFINNTGLEKVLFLSRPVSLFALYEKLSEIEKEIESKKEKKLEKAEAKAAKAAAKAEKKKK